MATTATMGHYSIYGALLQTPIEGPGFADDEEEDDTSMNADASADNVEAMAETLVVDFEPGDTLRQATH